MKKRIYIFLAFAVLLSGCSSISKMRASHHIKAAEKYLLEEDYEQAIIALNKAIELEPKNVDNYLLLAEAYQRDGQLNKSKSVLKKIKRFDDLTDEEIAKYNALNMKFVYKDILTNFYNTGKIGGSIDFDGTISEDYENTYLFKIVDVTGDGIEEIIIYRKSNESSVDTQSGKSGLFIYKVIEDKAVEIDNIFMSKDFNEIFFTDKSRTSSYGDFYSNPTQYWYYTYNDDISEYQYNEEELSLSELQQKKVLFDSDSIDTVLNIENIDTEIENMKIVDPDDMYVPDDTKDVDINNVKKLYKELLYGEYNLDGGYNYKLRPFSEGIAYQFTLKDVTGDGVDELILRVNVRHYSEDSFEIYSVVNGKVYNILNNDLIFRDIIIFEDNSVLVPSDGNNYIDYISSVPYPYDYYLYNGNISRFVEEKKGSLDYYGNTTNYEYLNNVIRKSPKLTGDDINIDITPENIEKMLK